MREFKLLADERCAEALSDFLLDLVRLAEMGRLQRVVPFYENVYHRKRDDGIAPCARYVRVHDGYYGTCALDCRKGGVHGGSEGNVAVFVRLRYLYHGHIDRKCPAAVQLLGLAEEYRNIVGVTCLYAFPYVPAYEKGLVEESAFVFSFGVRGRAFGVQVVDEHMFQFTGIASAAKGVNQDSRGAGHGRKMDMVAGFHNLYGLVGAYILDVEIHCFYIFILLYCQFRFRIRMHPAKVGIFL